MRLIFMAPVLGAALFQTVIGNAGVFVLENMYATHSLLQGFGKTIIEAKKDAMNALPAIAENGQWIEDPGNSPSIACSVSGGMVDGEYCKGYDEMIVITIPVIYQKK